MEDGRWGGHGLVPSWFGELAHPGRGELSCAKGLLRKGAGDSTQM